MTKKYLAIALIMALAVLTGCTQKPETDLSKIYIFDVGQGSAAFLQTPTTNMLIDTGDDERIIGYLNNLSIKKINLLMLTHPDKDHIGEAQNILENFEVDNVVWNGQASDTQTFQNLLSYIKENNITMNVANSSSKEFSFKVLNPQPDFYSEDNDNSIVSFVSFGNIDMLIGGDCSWRCESGLNIPNKAEIYIVNHHGSNTSSTQDFLNRLSPNLCIVSAGVGNQYGHPSNESLSRMESAGCQIFNTFNGSLVITTDGQEFALNRGSF